MKCFVWSVALHGAETWTLRRNEQKRLEAFGMWIWRRMVRIKWIEKIKNGKKSRRRKTNAGTDKEEGTKLAGPLAKKKLPAEGCSRRNGKLEEGSWQKKSDGRQHNDKWTVCRYEKED